MLKMFSFVFLVAVTFAQAPANLTGLEVTGQTNLSSQLTWSLVSGATYNVYSVKHDTPCPAPGTLYDKIASALTVTTYTDTPMNPNLGPYCYYVTATVGALESGASNVVLVHLGNHWYWYVRYQMADCATAVAMPNGLALSITQTRNGVQSAVPIDELGNDTFYGTARFYDDATYSAVITLPDGKQISYPAPLFLTGTPISASYGTNFNSKFVYGSDKWCFYQENNNLEFASSN